MATLPTLTTASPPGSNVTKSVQALLRGKFGQPLGPPNGNYGAETEQGVKNVQHFFGLAVDGIVGQQTWEVLLTA
jgi:peptidoglycan hydrolase-like protein with peptidoglycan-binding domain